MLLTIPVFLHWNIVRYCLNVYKSDLRELKWVCPGTSLRSFQVWLGENIPWHTRGWESSNETNTNAASTPLTRCSCNTAHQCWIYILCKLLYTNAVCIGDWSTSIRKPARMDRSPKATITAQPFVSISVFLISSVLSFWTSGFMWRGWACIS